MKSKMRLLCLKLQVFFETIQIVTITSSKTSMQLNEANSQRKDLEKSSKYLPLALDSKQKF